MYVTYTRIYGWSDYGGESSYQPGYRLENMMWMTLLVYDYIIPGEKKQYTPGVYTSTLTLNNTNLEVEVAVTDSEISSIRFSNLDETVTTMFPLVQPALEDIADQICRTQSLENISFPEDAPYTSQLILNAVTQAVEKATVQ